MGARRMSSSRCVPGARIRVSAGYSLPETLQVASDFDAAVAEAELLVVATPLAGLRATLQRIAEIAPGKPLVWVCKG